MAYEHWWSLDPIPTPRKEPRLPIPRLRCESDPESEGGPRLLCQEPGLGAAAGKPRLARLRAAIGSKPPRRRISPAG